MYIYLKLIDQLVSVRKKSTILRFFRYAFNSQNNLKKDLYCLKELTEIRTKERSKEEDLSIDNKKID